MLWELEASCCRGIWGHPRTAKHRAPDLLERGSGVKNKYQEIQGRISTGSSSWLRPRRGPSLRASFPGQLAQHFLPWRSCLHKPGRGGQFFLPGTPFSCQRFPPAPATAAPWSSWAQLQIAGGPVMPNASRIAKQEALASLNCLLL